MENFIVSTGDVKMDYEVIRPVHYYHITLSNKETFGEKNIPFDDVIDRIIDLLKEESIAEGGNGIIYLRVSFNPLSVGGSQIFVYGTMIKTKELKI